MRRLSGGQTLTGIAAPPVGTVASFVVGIAQIGDHRRWADSRTPQRFLQKSKQGRLPQSVDHSGSQHVGVRKRIRSGPPTAFPSQLLNKRRDGDTSLLAPSFGCPLGMYVQPNTAAKGAAPRRNQSLSSLRSGFFLLIELLVKVSVGGRLADLFGHKQGFNAGSHPSQEQRTATYEQSHCARRSSDSDWIRF